MLLLVGIAALGYRSIQVTSEGFDEYNRLAELNVTASDLETNLFRAAYNTARFADSLDPKSIEAAREALIAAKGKIEEAEKHAIRQDRKDILAELGKGDDLLAKQVEEARQSLLTAHKQYQDVVQPNATSMQENLLGIAAQANSLSNANALYALNLTWDSFAKIRSAVSRFAESRVPEDAVKVHQYLTDMEKNLAQLGSSLVSEAGRELFKGVMSSYTALKDAFGIMETQNGVAEASLAAMQENLAKEIKTTDAINSGINAQMTQFEKDLHNSNNAAQTQMLTIGIIGVLLGVACAFLIIFGITRVLSELARFAGAVAHGDFSYQLKIKEKGEIGAMVAAMGAIPAVLEKVMRESDSLANAILSGRFRDRLNSSGFEGSFAALTKSVNAVGDAYTNVLDSLPLPVMSSDKQNALLFQNRNAESAIGGNLASVSESGAAGMSGQNNAAAYGAAAMSDKAAARGEATIHPNGRRMDIAVTAMPMQDMRGAVVGYMEIVTDLTEIKAQQTTMLNVARDASEISDRVAAAAEELSAQVEQISHGAEMQRTRVESTASAMTEMNATVLEVARNAGQAAEQSNDTREKAENGADLVNKVVQAINTINSVAVTLQDNMRELGGQAESIGGVMNVISDIADQTNLLALNAAIEAARAGEAGRGFAVVADEVRKLAEKTMTATQEVGGSINAIQASTRTNIGEVDNAVKGIYDATTLANSSGAALNEIVHLAAANSAVVASIATAAEQQSATSEEINRAVDEINLVVGETSQGMIQSAAAVQDLSRMAQELRTVMSKLS